jgi:hypothetical protein
MSKRINHKLQENGAGKYMVSISLTHAEIKESIRALTREISRYRVQKRDMERSGDDRTRIARQVELISQVLSYLHEALASLKKAEQARSQGRYEAKLKEQS